MAHQKTNTTWTTSQLDKLRKTYMEGGNLNELAKSFGKSRYYLEKKAVELGILPELLKKTKNKKDSDKKIGRPFGSTGKTNPDNKEIAEPKKQKSNINPIILIERELDALEKKMINAPDIKTWDKVVREYNTLSVKYEQMISRLPASSRKSYQ